MATETMTVKQRLDAAVAAGLIKISTDYEHQVVPNVYPRVVAWCSLDVEGLGSIGHDATCFEQGAYWGSKDPTIAQARAAGVLWMFDKEDADEDGDRELISIRDLETDIVQIMCEHADEEQEKQEAALVLQRATEEIEDAPEAAEFCVVGDEYIISYDADEKNVHADEVFYALPSRGRRSDWGVAWIDSREEIVGMIIERDNELKRDRTGYKDYSFEYLGHLGTTLSTNQIEAMSDKLKGMSYRIA